MKWSFVRKRRGCLLLSLWLAYQLLKPPHFNVSVARGRLTRDLQRAFNFKDYITEKYIVFKKRFQILLSTQFLVSKDRQCVMVQKVLSVLLLEKASYIISLQSLQNNWGRQRRLQWLTIIITRWPPQCSGWPSAASMSCFVGFWYARL